MTQALELIRELFRPDQFLHDAISTMGSGVYYVLFLIIFAETGLVVTPFLPGDSLLFAAGAIAATGLLDVWWLAATLLAAAILGDAVNYVVGRYFGRAILRRDSRLIKREYVAQAHAFFEKHGGKAIVLARFVPIVRTFAPFVAGMCEMPILRFWAFNITGAFAWVTLFLGAGYLFGNLPWIEDNITLGMLIIVLVSVVPIVIETVKHRARSASEKAQKNTALPED